VVLGQQAKTIYRLLTKERARVYRAPPYPCDISFLVRNITTDGSFSILKTASVGPEKEDKPL
jgi:hypothetical protein